MSQTDPKVTTQLSAVVVSVIRTVVPSVWGAAIAWLLLRVPALESLSTQIDLFGEVLTVLVIGAWYALWRKVEPRLPAWVRSLTLGLSLAPAVYIDRPAKVGTVEVGNQVVATPGKNGSVIR